MYERLPTKEEAVAAGFEPEDYASDPVELWPENWATCLLFDGLRTQWRVGSLGPTGLDYNVLYKKMDRMGLSAEEYDQLEADIQVMEYAALAAMCDNHD